MPIEIISWNSDEANNNNSQLHSLQSSVSGDVFDIINYIQGFRFVEVSDNGLCINTNLIQSQQEFMIFVDHTFKNNFYFEWLDYEIFSKIIFDYQSLEWEKIKLCNSLKSIPEERRKKYTQPTLYKKAQAEYTFCKLYDEVEENGKIVEKEFQFNIDEFIARMWLFGIKFWLKIDDIIQIIHSGQTQRILIADTLPPTPWEDAKLITLVNLGKDCELQRKFGWNLDLKNYKRVFPQVVTGIKLYKKIELKPWINGMNIQAEIITPDTPQDISLEDIAWEGVVVVEENGQKFLTSSRAWYVTPLQGNYSSKEVGESEKKLMEISIWEIKEKLQVTKEIQLWVVGPETGNIEALWDVHITGMIRWYNATAYNIVSIGETHGSLYAKNDIKIVWNVSGWIHKQTQDGILKILKDGQIISEKWNISITGNILNRSHIQALEWIIECDNVEASVIVWKDIKLKNARGTICIWEEITIEWQAIDCLFICTKTFQAKQTTTYKNSENILFILKPEDYEAAYQKVWELLKALQTKSSKLHDIITQLQQENKDIAEDKRIQLFSLIIKKHQARKELTPQEQKIFSSLWDWYKTKVAKYEENRKKLEQAHLLSSQMQKDIEKLSQDFNRLSALKQEQINPSVEIQFNQWTLKLLWLIFEKYKKISELTQEDIDNLLDIQGLFSQKHAKYETILQTSEIKLSWKLY